MSSVKLFILFITVCVSNFLIAQTSLVNISGTIKDKSSKKLLPYVSVVIKNKTDNSFVTGTATNENGFFTLKEVKPGNYYVEITYVGYQTFKQNIFVGKLNNFLDLGTVELIENVQDLNGVVVTAKQEMVKETMDKKIFKMDDNFSQAGSSVLQAMKNLPGITISQEGKVFLRGSDKVTILIDGKQTALTGFGSQAGLDNIPASSIEKIEVINNPSAKNDANGSAGIINIILKKNKKEGWNGKVGVTTGIGALWQKETNLPTIRPQYLNNHKINPSIALNYRKKDINWFFQGDLINQRVLNKNEFITREYSNGNIVKQQFLENRTQTITVARTGLDWNINQNNTLTLSALYNREAHIDRGDLPYFNKDLSQRNRLWQYYEDEVNTAVNASLIYEHKYKQSGHKLTVNLNYTFHREDEKFRFDNYLTNSISNDATLLIADENVSDLNIDYIKPLKAGRLEVGTKLRWRYIPTNMKFEPGQNSVLDLGAQGWANYNEYIAALYTNYIYENKNWEVEAGLRAEMVKVNYDVTPQHNTYKSDGYNYLQPFPNMRLAYLINDKSRISLFYNRRVDRPDEQDLRIFPKYDDPEILKTGNPALQPQFTNTIELGYKTNWLNGYLYTALYTRFINNILTRIITAPTNSTFINSISQNAGNGRNEGVEILLNQEISKSVLLNINLNAYQNTISAFTINNVYPFNVFYSANKEQLFSGNLKLNALFKFSHNWQMQLTSVYLAPDLIPQGRIESRYALDIGVKKSIQKNKAEIFANASDILNTMRINKVITADGFTVKSRDLYETQIIRVGYSYKF